MFSLTTPYEKKLKATRYHSKACEVKSSLASSRYRLLADRLWTCAKQQISNGYYLTLK